MTTIARPIYLWKVVYSRLYLTLVFDFLLDFSNSDSTALVGKDTYVSPCKVCPVKDRSYLVVSIASFAVWQDHSNLKRTFFLLNARTSSLMAFFPKVSRRRRRRGCQDKWTWPLDEDWSVWHATHFVLKEKINTALINTYQSPWMRKKKGFDRGFIFLLKLKNVDDHLVRKQ